MNFRHISKIEYVNCVVHVAIKTLFWFVTFLHINTHTHTHTQTHTHTHTHTHIHTQIKILLFFWKDRESKYTNNWDNTGPRNLIQAKFKIFNENIRPNKDSGQIVRNKLTCLHYLNKMIEKYKMRRKFIFCDVSCF